MHKQLSVDGKWFYIIEEALVAGAWISVKGKEEGTDLNYLPFSMWDLELGVRCEATKEDVHRYEDFILKVCQ